MKTLHVPLIAAILIAVSSCCCAASHWVSPTGNDNNPGTQQQPWQSLSKASASIKSGDSLYLSGVLNGTLSLDAPCTVQGPATIDAGSGSGVYIYDAAGVSIKQLMITGSGTGSNSGSGVLAYADLPNGVKLQGLTLANLTISGFGQSGITIGSWNGSTGWANVNVSNCTLYDNLLNGFNSYSQSAAAHPNWCLTNVTAYGNLGTSGSGNSGSGICLGDVTNCLVDHCVAYDNGAQGNGGVGIWTYASSYVTIENCISYSNHTSGTCDGDGYDLDGGTTNSTLQYNYSYQNDGAGFLVCEYSGAAPNSNNVVRYNISQNDGAKNGYAALSFFSTIGCLVYGNTTYGSAAAVNMWDWNGSQLAFYNNDFFTTGDLIACSESSNTATFRNNNLHTCGSSWNVWFNGKDYTSVASWESSQLAVNPNLASPGNGPSGYIQNSDSPLHGAGADLCSLGISCGSQDFYGSPLPAAGQPFDIGAEQAP